MSIADSEKTGAFMRSPCPDCRGTGELRIDSENINENFEVEKQTVITPCPRCGGTGFISPDHESSIVGNLPA
jgi:DnaJ-class molecular chaperone